ncbi:hypothetical protein [Acidicapsa acidisoli]|uniref:hypothetical protein n=1 Tax=Acidicapsa acidisoli TaxID=1615681 RepID=UPI0021E06A23|nr:hypothetical protein [Acidicapsa acidisoli]
MAYSVFGGDEFGEAALAFARNCLLQPDSFLGSETFGLSVRPDGYNTGPEMFSDCRDLDYRSLDQVMMVVTHWCQLNNVKLEILFSGESFICQFIEGDPVDQIIETAPTMNLCFALLNGCSTLAQHMKNIIPPRPSRSWSDFTGRDD